MSYLVNKQKEREQEQELEREEAEFATMKNENNESDCNNNNNKQSLDDMDWWVCPDYYYDTYKNKIDTDCDTDY